MGSFQIAIHPFKGYVIAVHIKHLPLRENPQKKSLPYVMLVQTCGKRGKSVPDLLMLNVPSCQVQGNQVPHEELNAPMVWDPGAIVVKLSLVFLHTTFGLV